MMVMFAIKKQEYLLIAYQNFSLKCGENPYFTYYLSVSTFPNRILLSDVFLTEYGRGGAVTGWYFLFC